MITQQQEALPRSSLYELLSLAFLYPREGAWRLLLGGARELCSAGASGDRTAMDAALDRLRGELESSDDETLATEYADVFGHTISTDCAPYESEYGQAHVFQKSQTLADLGTFYQAFGVEINPELKDRLDHLSVEMEFMHLLTLKERHARLKDHGEDKALLCRQAQEAFLADHLATWVPSFARRLEKKTRGSGVYGALARLLEVHMDSEFQAFRLESTSPSSEGPLDASEEDLDCDPLTSSASVAREL